MATNATAAPSAPTSLLTNYEAYAATTALHREQRKQPSSEPPRLLERNLHDLRGRAGPHISSKVPSNFRRNLAIGLGRRLYVPQVDLRVMSASCAHAFA
jgi:hypothetical protein